MMKIKVLSPRLFAVTEDIRSPDGDMNTASHIRKQEVYSFDRGAFGLSHVGKRPYGIPIPCPAFRVSLS
jgi:hypothetical protein